MTCGVYRLRDLVGDDYIGSSKNIEKRWKGHVCDLKSGNHINRKVQASWNNHGSFEKRVLLICSEADLLFYEQLCLDALKPTLNASRIAGKVDFTDEVRAKIAGWDRTPEIRAKMAARKIGVRRSAEACAAVSAGKIGRPMPKGHGAKITAGQWGNPEWAAEAREKRQSNGSFARQGEQRSCLHIIRKAREEDFFLNYEVMTTF